MQDDSKKCKYCQTDMPFKATICPNCKKDQRNRFRKHPILTLILIIVIIWIVGAINSPQNSWALVNNWSWQESNQTSFKLWDEFKIGNFTYKVTKVETKKTLWNSTYSKTASWVYKIIYLDATNWDKEPRMLDNNMLKLKDNNQNTYSYSSEWNTAFNIQNKNNQDFFLKQMQPGLKISGSIVFDIPDNLSWLQLEVTWWVFSKDKTTVNLE